MAKVRNFLKRNLPFQLFWGLVLATTVVESLSSSSSLSKSMKVAVIGTTGRLGRETVVRLSKKGIATRCLLRHDCSQVTAPPASLEQAQSKAQVAAFLNTLPGVELVAGDVTDADSLKRLLDADTTACLAVYGPVMPKPWFRSLFPLFFPESAPTHPKRVNYEGVKNILSAMEASAKCRRLVRITGKGEQPVRPSNEPCMRSFFSIVKQRRV